jgi:hypothetical protein
VTAGPRAAAAAALVLLILTGDARSDDLAAWRRGRSVLLGVDKKIAGTRAGCRVRALPGGAGAAQSPLRQAGGLRRRHLKRPARAPDFARALGAVAAAVTRDVTALGRSGLRVARPAVVFYAVEPPLADAITAEEYFKLTQLASILWVVPETSAPLMSEWFAGDDTCILTDHDAVIDEVAYLLSQGAAAGQTA